MEFEQKTGALIPAAEVRVSVFNAARRARDLLLAVPDRVAAVLAGTTDAQDCHRILTEEIRRVCGELSRVEGIAGEAGEPGH